MLLRHTIILRSLGALVVLGLAVNTCVSVPDDLDTEGCIDSCTTDLVECLDVVEVPCPTADDCFDTMQTCFDDANQCSKDCSGCEDEGTCYPHASEADCGDICSDMANECTDLIDTCVDHKETCIQAEKDLALECMPIYGNCAGACVGEAEDAIRDML